MFSKLPLALSLAGLVFAAPAPQIDVEEVSVSFTTIIEASATESTGGSSSCTKFVTAATGDDCSTLAAANGLTASTFMQMNPSINAECTNLIAGTQYCVATSSSSSPTGASGSGTSGAPETIATSNPVATSNPASSSNAIASSNPPTISTTPTTSTPPNPTQLSDPNTTQVTNATAFTSNAGNKKNTNENDGIGAGTDTYICYSGTASAYPDSSKWVSFSDMWTANAAAILKGCSNLSPSISPDTTEQQLTFMKSGIQAVAEASLVDHRFILATIMQESIGCVNTRSTTSSGGVNNPGLMQSHNGSSFIGSSATAAEQAASIQQMIVDGTQGTPFGDGQVQGINLFGNVYDAAHFYNSGNTDSAADLNTSEGATASYVVDIANRLTGWVTAPKITCS